MTSILFKLNIILIVLYVSMMFIHSSSQNNTEKDGKKDDKNSQTSATEKLNEKTPPKTEKLNEKTPPKTASQRADQKKLNKKTPPKTGSNSYQGGEDEYKIYVIPQIIGP